MILTKVKNEVGATAIEYGLIASLVAVLAVSGMSAVGMNLSNTYCTVSKYLGGSGTCSGATSSGADSNGSTGGSESTSGNSSNGSSTGSVNSTNSIANGASLKQVMAGLSENLNKNFVPSTMGGTDSAYGFGVTYRSLYGDEQVKDLSNLLSGINKTDPITNVFGVYDTSNNDNPITDYGYVSDALQKGGGNISMGQNYNSDFMEITTASGKVWTVTNDGGTNVKNENTKK